MASNWVYLDDCEATAETPDALLVQRDGEQVWIPKSQINRNTSEVTQNGDKGCCVVTAWIDERLDWEEVEDD